MDFICNILSAPTFTDWVTAGAAAATAWYVYQTYKSYRQIEIFTGAAESHSTLQARLKIEEMNRKAIDDKQLENLIEIVWWDPNIAPVPTQEQHGRTVGNQKIYFLVHPELRSRRSPQRKRRVICDDEHQAWLRTDLRTKQ